MHFILKLEFDCYSWLAECLVGAEEKKKVPFTVVVLFLLSVTWQVKLGEKSQL